MPFCHPLVGVRERHRVRRSCFFFMNHCQHFLLTSPEDSRLALHEQCKVTCWETKVWVRSVNRVFGNLE